MKNIRFLQSRAINEWGPIIKPLLPDFGPAFCQTIMEWCNIIPDNSDNYWEWFMIYDAYTPIGCCGVYSLTNERFPKELWLSWFGIIPEYRNKGIGKEALKFLEKWAKEIECESLLSYVDKAGGPLPFYKSQGFSILGNVEQFMADRGINQIDGEFFEDGEDFVIKKSL